VGRWCGDRVPEESEVSLWLVTTASSLKSPLFFFNYFASRYACGFVASLELTVVLSLLLADDVSRLLVISFTQQNLCSCLPFGSSSYIDSVCFFFVCATSRAD
jgi:hypothetical protein